MRDARRVETNLSVMAVSRLPRVARLVVLLLVPTLARGQAAGSLAGVVYDSLGGVVSSARISVVGSAFRATTDSLGAFRLAGLPAGDAVIEVKRLGYRPLSQAVTIRDGGELRLDLKLAPVPEQLAPVEVRRRTEAYDSRLAGFNERKSKHVGYFVTREKLDRMSSARFVDALREIPGVSLRTLKGGVATVSLRGARCAPMFYMDGFPATAGTMDLDMIDLSGVEGIEIYAGMSSIPPEFLTVVGGESCGVIAVWSRPTRARKQRTGQLAESDLERLLKAREVYTADQVDTPVQLTGASPAPVYPDSLWRAGAGGRVVAQFIVDSEGLVEPESLHIISTTQPYFGAAVRAALREATFRPALMAGTPVRQLVLLPFLFSPPPRDSVPRD
jgi:TonB family protein